MNNTAIQIGRSMGLSDDDQRRIKRRIDRRLIPIVGLMYCVSLVDRTNVAAASVAGMIEDLNLIGNRYSVIVLVFFITYVVFQPPSTVLVRWLGPRIHLAGITFLWGVVMIGMGVTKKWDQLAALRVLLGLFEAGFFPSCVYLLSTWYNRYEVGKRYGLFYAFGAVAGALAGLMAYGLVHLDGVRGMGGWRWLFIVEGTLTCVIAMAGYILLKFLSAHERAWVVARVNADRGDANGARFSLKLFAQQALDFKLGVFGLLFFCTSTQGYTLSFFTPIILTAGMGFDATATQLLQITPMLWAACCMFFVGWVGGKWRIPGPLILFNIIVGVRFLGLFLAGGGINSNIPLLMAYQANNIRGQWKRACASAIFVSFGDVGGIAGSLVFRPSDAPLFRPGLWACIACCLASIVMVVLLNAYFWYMNRQDSEVCAVTTRSHM
ncbi:major facilitator superfamily domain-containing protein [Aspergillus pseudodeflectus]|uniref:Major facilitator superfamily domain-containing protein n=1 Tax=Aspergillus pseudodeflectus TaxID=176178 RepID=A0ABR4JF58_9EURO